MNSPPGSNMQRNDMQHLDEMTLLLYLERQLDRERAAEVSAHMQECGACRPLSRALVTLGTFAAMILRRRLRRGSVLAVMLAGMCGALMLPAGASATDFRSGQNAEVSSGETIKGDVCLNGDRMSVDGTVNGDVFAF